MSVASGEECPQLPDGGGNNPDGCESGECAKGPVQGGADLCTGGAKGGRKKKKRRSGKKRGMNNFFKLMLAAKKKKDASFVYNGTTYYGHPHPMLGMVYKKSKAPLKNLGKTKKNRRGKSKKMRKKGKSKKMRKRGKSRKNTRKKGNKSRRRRR